MSWSKSSQKGFTLVELLFGVAILSIVSGIGTMAFASALRSQRNLIAEKKLSEGTRFAIEYMSRQLRLAQPEATRNCLGTIGQIYSPPASQAGQNIFFNDSDMQCTTFFLMNNEIKMSIGTATPIDLTSDSEVKIDSLHFTIFGGLPDDNLQPRVTIVMTAQGVIDGVPTGPIVPIQTTVSDRAIDVPQG